MKIKLKSWKKHLEKSIEMNQKEDEGLGDESGNSIPESLINKEKFKKNRWKHWKIF